MEDEIVDQIKGEIERLEQENNLLKSIIADKEKQQAQALRDMDARLRSIREIIEPQSGTAGAGRVVSIREVAEQIEAVKDDTRYAKTTITVLVGAFALYVIYDVCKIGYTTNIAIWKSAKIDAKILAIEGKVANVENWLQSWKQSLRTGNLFQRIVRAVIEDSNQTSNK